MTEHHWFEYTVRVRPHHTDYAGVVWHGTYIAWMEEARIEYLRSRGILYSDWVAVGVDLPVVKLSLDYRKPMTMGIEALVKTRMEPIKGVRIVWQYDIQDRETGQSCVLGTTVLVPVDRQAGKILRRLPPSIQKDFERL